MTAVELDMVFDLNEIASAAIAQPGKLVVNRTTI